MSMYEQRLQKDLDRIRGDVGHLGEVVEKSLKDATHALFVNDEVLANLTILADQKVNRQYRSIQRLCHNFIARHLPGAGHLRTISSVMRLIEELERIGDYATTICREAIHLEQPLTGTIQREAEMMAQDSRTMLHQALDAFNQNNAEVARGTKTIADQIGRKLNIAFDDIVKEGTQDPNKLRDLLDMHVVFYMLERVSDRAKNICEETLFMVTGETKPLKVFDVVFLDETNSCRSQMAEAIARKGFPKGARFQSAGRAPAEALHVGMVSFMNRHGFDVKSMRPKSLEIDAGELDSMDVVLVSLSGPARSHLTTMPFHAVSLTWDIGEPPADDDLSPKSQKRFEEIHREIAHRVQDLMDRLMGEEVN